jgi:hypothetical protein
LVTSLLVASFITGCAQKLSMVPARTLDSSERIFSKNYEKNKVVDVSVGDPIVKVKDFHRSTYLENFASPTQNVRIHGGLIDISLFKGQKYPIMGQFTLDSGEYLAAKVDGGNGVLFSNNGEIKDRIIGCNAQINGCVSVVYQMKIDPSDTKIFKAKSQEVEEKRGFVNFEIIYNGKDSESIFFTYREYTPKDLARAAFFQKLTYSADNPIIRFKKLKFEIIKASNEGIRFKVLED